MVPDKFNMVDMGGIDLIMMQGEEVPGLYNRLVESIAQCRYQCLYNWLFDGVIIPPTYVKMEIGDNDEIIINDGVTVTDDDVIYIHSLETQAVIVPLLAEENGSYIIPPGVDGFNPVTVDVPSYTPVIESLSVTENGTYTAPSGVDGYSPISVNVPASPAVIQPLNVAENGTYTPPSGVDGYAPIVVNVSGASEYLIIPIMTGSSAPYGQVTQSSKISGAFDGYMAFNGRQAEPSMQNGWLAIASDSSPFLRYDFVAPKILKHVTIFTANNSTTVFRTVYLEGYSNGEWENCLDSGNSVELEFRNGTNGSTCLEFDVKLNGRSYDAFRIRGTQPFYGGPNQYACTFSCIFMYGY